MQLVQLLFAVMRVPGEQGTHEAWTETNPALHWNGQFHAAVPTPVYVALSGALVHGKHCCDRDDQVPPPHATHTVPPERAIPATQAKGHDVALTPGPVHVALATRPVHAWHAVAPGEDEKVPFGQAAHITLLMAYAPMLQLEQGVYPYDTEPLGQAVHEDMPVALA